MTETTSTKPKIGRPRGARGPNGTHYATNGIAKARIKAGLTGREMCELLGFGGNQATKIERGEVALSAYDACILCDLFGVTIQELMEGVMPPKRRR